MDNVKIDKTELCNTVEKNRDEHRTLFLRAQEGYREMVIEELDKMLQDARDGKKLRVAIKMPAPEDHTEDYNTVIRMLEMSVDDVIELDITQFQQYVENNWRWAQVATQTNKMYANKLWK